MNKEKNKHNKQPDFKVPEGYFDSFESKLMDRIKESSSLSKKIDSGFTVPENYFENFKVKTSKPSVIPLRKLIYFSGVAAAIVLLFTFFVPDQEPTFDSLETATIENYLLNESYANTEIAGLLNDDDLSLETFDITIDSQDMEAYLLENTSVENLLDF